MDEMLRAAFHAGWEAGQGQFSVVEADIETGFENWLRSQP